MNVECDECPNQTSGCKDVCMKAVTIARGSNNNTLKLTAKQTEQVTSSQYSIILSAPKEMQRKWLRDTTRAERSFPEDAKHENGNYINECSYCLRLFTGHKHRVLCKVCESEAK